MAIERAIGPGGGAQFPPVGMDIQIPDGMTDDGAMIENTEDGVIVDLDPEGTQADAEAEEIGWFGNLAEVIDDSVLERIGSKVVDLYEQDENGRADWKQTYIKGLTLLGFKPEERTDPWQGACGVYHPVMTEAAVRFQSQAIMEIFPSSGPVRTKIYGKWSREKEQQAQRVKEEMNYTVLDKMPEFRPETEELLFYLSLAGSAFRKTYYDKQTNRPRSVFVPAEDFVVPYGTTSLGSAPRFHHVMRPFRNDINKSMASGLYREVEIPDPPQGITDLQQKKNKLSGESYAGSGKDERFTILETHIDLDLEGYEDESGVEMPFIVTVDRYSKIVLSIRRNWRESDPQKNRIKHFVAYRYLPGLSFYGSGLIHLIGGIAQSATSILRQLVDAGTLSNLPGGLKSRGLRIIGDETPIMPGEFRDVDVPSGTIKDNITFIPYKEPSQVLHALLGNIVEEGRKLGAAPDIPISSMTQQAPVGTTLALLERSMKIMSAVQARLHASLKEDYKLIAEIISEQGSKYEYEVEDPNADRSRDFSQVDIVPVSDPNASSQAYRVIQYQTLIELIRLDPKGWDVPRIKADFATVIGIPNADQLLKNDEDIQPTDPVTENMSILNQKPVKAFLHQDQEAHIQVHMMAIRDPKMAQMVGQSPQAGAVMAAAAAHITEHLAFQYRKEIEKQMGVPLPPPGQPLPPDVEVQLSKLVAQAAQRLFQKDQAELAQQQAQQQMQDPVLQMQMQELQIKKKQADDKAKEAQARIVLEAAKLVQKNSIEQDRLASTERVAGAALGKDIAESHAEFSDRSRQRAMDAATELMNIDMRARQLKEQEMRAKVSRKGKPAQ